MITTTAAEISSGERQLLAREIAADQRVGGGGYYNDNMREVFVSGWNAAIEYVEKERGTPSNVPNQKQANTDSPLAD